MFNRILSKLRRKLLPDSTSAMESKQSKEAQEEVKSFKPEPGSVGLFQLYPPEPSATHFEPQVDVVVLHGLGGHPIKTWTSKSDGTVWIRDLLPKTEGFRKARVLSFGYDATAFLLPFEEETKADTFQFAESLLNSLADHRVDAAAKLRPIVFIGHSLGGIVIKSALRHAALLQDDFGDILASTKAIVFFGTPHQGAEIAAWPALLENIGKYVGVRATKVVKHLKLWSDPLVQLTRQFKEIPGRFNIQITSFYETESILGQTIVPEASACMSITQERSVMLAANHDFICKFSQTDSLWNHTVQARFRAIALKMGIVEEVQNAQAGDDVSEFE